MNLCSELSEKQLRIDNSFNKLGSYSPKMLDDRIISMRSSSDNVFLIGNSIVIEYSFAKFGSCEE